jgi:Protein of unknown function (DUF2817)
MTTSPFSVSFSEAKAKFVEAAIAAGAALSSYTHPESGPDGGVLSTDCAWIGHKDAKAVLVLVSGTHGVEGFCGSGAQVDWLKRGEVELLGTSRRRLPRERRSSSSPELTASMRWPRQFRVVSTPIQMGCSLVAWVPRGRAGHWRRSSQTICQRPPKSGSSTITPGSVRKGMRSFYIDTDVWRGMVLGQSLMAVRKTITGLSRAVSA